MKKSIFKKMIAVFAVTFVISAVIILVGSRAFYETFTVKRIGMFAEGAYALIKNVLNEDELTLLKDSEEPLIYETYHTLIHSICVAYGLKYAYIFDVNPEKDERIYFLTVAADDELDKQVAKKLGRGTHTYGLHKSEREVYSGVTEFSEEIVNNEYGEVYSWYFPLKDNNGKIIAVVGIDYDSSFIYELINENILWTVTPLLLILFLMNTALIVTLRRYVFLPIKSISEKMYSFSPEVTFKASEIKAYGEINDIACSFEKMSEDIKKYIDDIKHMTNERIQAAAELDIARRIQSGMVPNELRLNGESFSVDAFAAAARQVGGDFYDCFEKDGKVFAIIGDVSGKGVAAALFMSMIKIMIREKLISGCTPAEALNASNDELCVQNPEGLFVTVFIAELDKYTGELRYANAGHTRPVLLRDKCGYLKPAPGIALGLFEDAGISDGFLMLGDEEGILLYTDGMTEAVNIKSEFFGEKLLLETLEGCDRENAAHTAANAVIAFEKGCERFDDLTLISLVRKKSGATHIRKALEPSLEAFDELRDVIFELSGNNAKIKKIILACEEVFVNIVDYSGTDSIFADCVKSGDTLVFRFEDGGKPFDPLNAELPEKSFDEFDTGGMGIMLMKKIASSTEYSRISGRNILKVIFRTE